jgi:hypothetical protein
MCSLSPWSRVATFLPERSADPVRSRHRLQQWTCQARIGENIGRARAAVASEGSKPEPTVHDETLAAILRRPFRIETMF